MRWDYTGQDVAIAVEYPAWSSGESQTSQALVLVPGNLETRLLTGVAAATRATSESPKTPNASDF